jgi:hypothetical protein
MDSWKKSIQYPQFKAEAMVHFGGVEPLTKAAQVTAKRLSLGSQETSALIESYIGYTREMRGEGVKPVPPVIFGITKASLDHTAEKYQKVTLPMYAAMNPPPKVSLVKFDAGTHGYTRAEPGLPMGLAPAVAKLWYDAIMGGYYADYAREWSNER